jgi:hypothetical protein
MTHVTSATKRAAAAAVAISSAVAATLLVAHHIFAADKSKICAHAVSRVRTETSAHPSYRYHVIVRDPSGSKVLTANVRVKPRLINETLRIGRQVTELKSDGTRTYIRRGPGWTAQPGIKLSPPSWVRLVADVSRSGESRDRGQFCFVSGAVSANELSPLVAVFPAGPPKPVVLMLDRNGLVRRVDLENISLGVYQHARERIHFSWS